MHRIAGGEAEVERLGRGQADVFDRHAHDAAGDVHGIFAGLEHAAEPVERGVGVGVADGFVQGGDDVVVLLALLVVEQDAALEGFGGDLPGDAMTGLGGEAGGDVEGVEGIARVAAGVGGDGGERVFVGGDAGCAEATGRICKAASAIGEGTLEEGDDLRFGERLQNVDAAAGEQRGDQLEGGVLGGGADQTDGAALDVRQEGVLLGLVEAVGLVDEEDGAGAQAGGLFGGNHHLLDLLDAGHDRGELDEGRVGERGDDLGERGFAGTGRAPEDHGGGIVVGYCKAQGLARTEQMLLADELLERVRTHALGQWGVAEAGCGGGGDRRGVEEAHACRFEVRGSRFEGCWRWRDASYSSSEPATAALRLSTGPGVGMVMRAVAIWRSSVVSPEPSLPIIRAQGWARSAAATGRASGPWGLPATAAKRHRPRDFRARMSAGVAATTGTRKTEPAQAR